MVVSNPRRPHTIKPSFEDGRKGKPPCREYNHQCLGPCELLQLESNGATIIPGIITAPLRTRKDGLKPVCIQIQNANLMPGTCECIHSPAGQRSGEAFGNRMRKDDKNTHAITGGKPHQGVNGNQKILIARSWVEGRKAAAMELDPENPVVKLCAEGIETELGGEPLLAKDLYEKAWTDRSNDLEACIAAHYLARVQPTPEENLAWNERALTHGQLLPFEDVQEFLPSLHLNVGKSLENLGRADEARRHYELAAEHARVLPDDGYGKMIRHGIEKALKRSAGSDQPQEP